MQARERNESIWPFFFFVFDWWSSITACSHFSFTFFTKIRLLPCSFTCCSKWRKKHLKTCCYGQHSRRFRFFFAPANFRQFFIISSSVQFSSSLFIVLCLKEHQKGEKRRAIIVIIMFYVWKKNKYVKILKEKLWKREK